MLAACAVLFSAAWLGLSHTTQAQGLPAKGGSTDAPQCDPNWQVVSTAGALNGGVLSAISVASPSDIWAVGYYLGHGGAKTLAMHWDGTSWSVKNGPNGSTQDNYLFGVEAISANDVWAVGYYNNGVRRTLTIHWNGSSWALVSSPNVGTHDNILRSVASVSGSGSVWAVGSYDEDLTGIHDKTLTMRWNGFQWTTISSPNPDPVGANFLYGITAAGPSLNDLWAVGCYQGTAGFGLCGRSLILHWNTLFGQWLVSTSPNPASAEVYLYSITAVSSGELWAVGTHGPNGVGKMTLTMHYINNAWSIVPSPNPTGSSSYLQGVSAVSANDVWGVGNYNSGSGFRQTLIEHWNGSSWAVVPSPNVGSDNNLLYGVAAVSATDVWSVGYVGNLASPQTLAERYNPCN